MTSETRGEAIENRLTPETLALFHRCLNELAMGFKALPDKPDETTTGTLAALWHTAAGGPISVQRAAIRVLPELGQDEIAKLNMLLRERIAGVPLAYLTGRQQFMGVELIATADALIPREETALLGDTALMQLRAIVRERGHAKVIDVCTGSGNLALALAWHEPCARVWGTDLSKEAITLARRNLAHLDLADRVEFRCGDLLSPFDSPEFHGHVDLLVCNPPYISSGKVDGMANEIIGFEPRMAFDGGPLGIQTLLRLIAEAPRYLRDGGWLAFEIGLGQGQGIRKRLEQNGRYVDVREVADKHGQTRTILARSIATIRQLQHTRSHHGEHNYVVTVAAVHNERERICALWRTGLNAANLYEAKFDWYYRNSPEGTPDVLFLRYGGDTEAVGVAAAGHRKMRFNGSTITTGVLVDFVVQPEHRTLFPALFLQKEMHRFALQTHPIIWGMPNPKATAIFSRAGYTCIGQMVRYVRVIRSASYLARYLPQWFSRLIGPMIDVTRRGVKLFSRSSMRDFVSCWQDRPDARFNDLWQRSAAPNQLMGVRDEQYLTWRFSECPFHTHSFLTLVSTVDDQLVAYAVCEKTQQTFHVSDFLVDSNAPDVAMRLWREVKLEAFRAGYASLSTEFLGSELVQQDLERAGLVKREQSPVFTANSDRSPPLLRDTNWYLTRADLDV